MEMEVVRLGREKEEERGRRRMEMEMEVEVEAKERGVSCRRVDIGEKGLEHKPIINPLAMLKSSGEGTGEEERKRRV
ncbi:hypothetical protein M0802_011644 [Mischocyttarus mexicanus]|nr:hypothetical protein M0802_011644 [Mischocyttarus mexicanus]